MAVAVLLVMCIASTLAGAFFAKPTVWSPVFPNVSFIFRDSYDYSGWRLTKPDFSLLPQLGQPDLVMTVYMRKATSYDVNGFEYYPFYSVNCTDCEVSVSYSLDGGWTWGQDCTLLRLPTALPYGWFARPGPRLALQDLGNVTTLHVFISRTSEDRHGLYHAAANVLSASLPSSLVNKMACEMFSQVQLQEIIPSRLATPPHTPIVVNGGKRIVLADHKVARTRASKLGLSNTFVLYSDDRGSSWQSATPELTVPSPHGGDGACEPTVIELMNGTLWMLIRNNNPVLYQSFSFDHGTTWTQPTPTQFASWNSPAILIRLSARKPGILLVWNNGFKVRGDGWYEDARQVIHAAVSYDEGMTWSGFRELYRDPHMAGVYKYGDHGTAYPTGKETENGTIILATGQGAFRQVVLLFDPNWLLETDQLTTIDEVTHLNNSWDYDGNYFTTLGTAGLDIIIDPTNASCSRDLKVIRMQETHDDEHPPSIVYNFPGSKKGSLSLFFYPALQNTSVHVSLMDFFTLPEDVEVEDMATFSVTITSNKSPKNESSNTIYVTPTEYHIVELDWDTRIGACNVSVENILMASLRLRPESELFTKQPSYLRFRLVSGMLYLRTIEAQLD